jgi:hypothetical protein
MTIVVCAGVFVLGLLSNHLIGRNAVRNRDFGVVEAATPEAVSQAAFRDSGDSYRIRLKLAPRVVIRPGASCFYGPTPNGFPLITPWFGPFRGDPAKEQDQRGGGVPPAIIVTSINGRDMTIRNIGETPVPVSRPPQPGDYVFAQPTTFNYAAMAAWGVIPNMHAFWTVDALTQNTPVPMSHVGLVVMYAAVQITAFLALGVILFQKRDVG